MLTSHGGYALMIKYLVRDSIIKTFRIPAVKCISDDAAYMKSLLSGLHLKLL